MILVVAEASAARVSPASLETIAAAQQTGQPVTVVLPGKDVAAAIDDLAGLELASVVALEHQALETYTSDGWVTALAPFVASESPECVLSAHTYQSRDFMPALAAKLERGLATDCTGLSRESGHWIFTRPMFGGKLSAEVECAGPPPHLATVQLGVFGRTDVRRAQNRTSVRTVTADLDATRIRQRPEPPFREDRAAVDLTQASRIVAVGRGVAHQDQLKVVEALASALGAELAASRPICDAGWLPMDRQVGSSGQTVAPKLYVAVGISGAIQHIVGMRGSGTIVAINKDPQAPIFEIADFGIVGDLFDVVPALVRALKA